MKKKYIPFIISLIVVAFVGVAITVAYFTDTDKSVNVFTVGDVDITLSETKVNQNGEVSEENERVKENQYHLIPGHEYTKEPIITITAGSEEAHIRALITLTNYKELKEIFGNDFTLTDLISGLDENTWLFEKETINNDNTVTYEYRYYKTESGFVEEEEVSKDLTPIFNKVIIPGEITNQEIAKLESFEITIIAEAIQDSGFNGNADAAWSAFEEQNYQR